MLKLLLLAGRQRLLGLNDPGLQAASLDEEVVVSPNTGRKNGIPIPYARTGEGI